MGFAGIVVCIAFVVPTGGDVRTVVVVLFSFTAGAVVDLGGEA